MSRILSLPPGLLTHESYPVGDVVSCCDGQLVRILRLSVQLLAHSDHAAARNTAAVAHPQPAHDTTSVQSSVMSDRRIRQTQLPRPTIGSVRPNCPIRLSDPSDPTANCRISQTQLPCPTVGSVRPNCPIRPSDPSDPTVLSDRRISQTQLPCPTVGSVIPNCPVRPLDPSDPTADCRISQTQLPCPIVGSVIG